MENTTNSTQEVVDKASWGQAKRKTAEVPDDFAERLATKVIVINERELDDAKVSKKTANLLYRNVSSPDMLMYFPKAIEYLLEGEDLERYAAIAWVAIVIHGEDYPEYKLFVSDLISLIVQGYKSNKRPDFQVEFKNKDFSAYAHDFGEVFISMMRINNELYDVITELFGGVIKKEMADEELLAQAESDVNKKISLAVKKKKDGDGVSKKLYDDIIDYVSYRSEFRSDSLNQKNPNEFIIVLADRMRATRRYIIQDLMNKRTLSRKKQIEKEWGEREASAEEMISAGVPFKKGIHLFLEEKRYNFKYLAVEKVRVTLQVSAVILGIGACLWGFVKGGWGHLGIGGFTLIFMMFYSKIVCSRVFFIPYYPIDVSNELEQEVGAFTPVFRKFSAKQLNNFLTRQIKDPKNSDVIQLIPEYFKYIYAVVPEKDKLLIGTEEFQACIEQYEINLSKGQI